jgi:hypothetical protein
MALCGGDPMTTPDIAGLCKDLLRFSRNTCGMETNNRVNPDGPKAADTIERQAAEIERLRGENHDLRSIPWPRAYVLERASEWKRLLREIGGYVKTCRGSCGSDMAGRDHAIAATAEAVAMIENAEAQAALTGED